MNRQDAPKPIGRTVFGFEAVMAQPDYSRFPAWCHENWRLPNPPFEWTRPDAWRRAA